MEHHLALCRFSATFTEQTDLQSEYGLHYSCATNFACWAIQQLVFCGAICTYVPYPSLLCCPADIRLAAQRLQHKVATPVVPLVWAGNWLKLFIQTDVHLDRQHTEY